MIAKIKYGREMGKGLAMFSLPINCLIELDIMEGRKEYRIEGRKEGRKKELLGECSPIPPYGGELWEVEQKSVVVYGSYQVVAVGIERKG